MIKFISKKVDTPTTLQMEAVECGAASLCMILEYYGNYVPLETLRIECGVSRDGSKASNILKAARRYGMEAKGYRKNPEDLLSMKLPMIVFWNFAHFLVVEGFSKKGEVFINDPAGGKKVLSWEDFDKSFTGVVLTFNPTKEFNGNNKRASIFPGLYRRLKSSLPQLSIAVIAGIFMTIPGLMIPIFTKVFIDDYLIKGMTDWVIPLILIMIATALVNAALNFLQQYYLLKMQNAIAIKESSKLFWHIIRLPMDFFNQRFAGEIGNRISLNNKVASIISGQFAVNIIGVISIFMYAILMFYYDVILTIVSLFFILLNVFVFKKIIKKAAIRNQRLSIEEGKLLGISMSGLQSIETLKAGASENDFFVKWSGHQAKMQNATNDMFFLSQASTLFPALFTTLNIAIVLILGSLRVIDGYMTMGMLVAFQGLMHSLTMPINNLLALSTTIKHLEGDMSYLDDVLKYPLDKDNKENLEEISSSKLDGKIELKKIAFGYSVLEEPLVKDFNLIIEPGKRVAFVGSSGSGKSTIAKVLTGLYKPWEGSIYFDDKNIDNLSSELITNSVSMVDQDISLFRGTIKENITLWNDLYSDKEIIQACKDACIHDIIASLPDAYNTMIEENGRNFSGGQKQRIEIARAFLSNPSILILDEATSALDPITEMKIDENIRRRGCSSIIIAHRLSTIRDADLIVVLDKGVVVQSGNHNELKNEEGLYSNLIKG